ncbi:hypothetical protein G8770_00580 [Aestuariicella hydrocarbonica]|uniref:Uncharacterized protein n=1 Tax=Pseudomaricurvus hydrocarbonicus TaxID=1470433 RepID=A0A9E5MLK1_9GAMM|nr:hypothetical protein [Aestuariicella hydrocarbonica]NHO64040.1 hypothetical protein [Aestuariicella hydrocarbonica]
MKTIRQRNVTTALLSGVLLLVIFSPLSLAQATTQTEDTTSKSQQQQESQEEQKQTDTPKAAATKTGSGQTDPNFTPSEQVSEDLSVSFPVDI